MHADAMPRPAAAAPRRGLTQRRWWPAVKRTVGIVFIVCVLALMANLARQFDWMGALRSLRALPLATLALAAVLAGTSYLLFSAYDLIGRHETRHGLPVRRVLGIAATVYAFNLNLGTLVGGIALRVRLYAQQGLAADVIARLIALSVATNWLGWMLLAGTGLLLAPPALPAGWGAGAGVLHGVGCVLLLVVGGYVGACSLARPGKGRHWQWRDWSFDLPPGRIALAQVALASANWMVLATVAWVLLRQQVPYGAVLVTLLMAAVAGLVVRVPAGLGVLEGVFIALLGSRVPQDQLLAALLAYRALYYLAPLLLAGLSLLLIEARTKRASAASGST